MEIYRTLYSGRGLTDDMELERLVMDLEESYRVKAVHAWHEKITLGDLFQKHAPRHFVTGRGRHCPLPLLFQVLALI